MTRLTASEVARLLGLPNADAVWREARLGRIPHLKLGRRYLFYADTLEAWRREPAVRPTHPTAVA